jgi:predicted PurR-regulated permease PerM
MSTESHDKASVSAPARLLGPTASIRAGGRVSWAIVGMLIVLALGVAAFVYTRSVSVPIILAIVLAVVFQPVADWLVNRGMSRGAAAAVALLALLLVVIGIIALVSATLVANWDEISADLSKAADELDSFLKNTPLSDQAASETKDSADSSGSTMATGVGAGLASVFNSAAGVAAGMFFGLWVAYYVLQGGYFEDSPDTDSDSPDTDSSVSGLRSKWNELIEYARTSIRGYYTGQTVLGLFDAMFIALPMALLGIPGAVAVGVVTLFGSYVPYVGAFVAGGLAVLLALADGGASMAAIMLVIVLLVQNTLENIVQPRITAKYVNLSPLVILLATAIGGVVAGLIGVILAVPFTAVLFKAVALARQSGDFAGSAPAADSS